ncbi:hypothetical protein MIT9_P1688 [Methylomarinovum caldicuralii]|uniref:Glycosyltransferase 2-like domain-containing protein n=1 Tax=Methylomarinovum caldicuralii TaxID=438856 RepID=A0AAU9C4N1_9GAMM|nr:hypothetical protein [Methylomarinovum caldicuralii]BCX82104.1 hypothetical protein MIT9_P1688 [Methylomarinovum caldicuralii]
MLYRLKTTAGRTHFAWACRKIYATPPLDTRNALPVTVVTQLRHCDVILYLVAIKSFASRVPFREAIILDDGSLTPRDRQTIGHHIPHSRTIPITRFRDPACPAGGAWERLLAIAEFSRDRYVIQLDSDTLTRAPLEEVCNHIDSNTAFVIGTWDRQGIETMRACSERVQQRVSSLECAHVQLAAEAAFIRLPRVDELNYVRGCAGFAGFPAGSIERGFISEFSQAMESLLGSKWHEWGSEQVMSNVVIANLPEARVLPHPKYTDCSKMTPDTHFIHFVGSCRFKNGRYARLGAETIRNLRNS